MESVLDRTKFIGGSDAAGVLGRSRWATPLSVWAEKTGQFVKPEVDSEATELGRELEDYVAKRFERKTGKKVERVVGTFFHPEHDYLGANVDRLIPWEDAGLECKTASAFKAREWEGDEIPQEYIIQCYHYMMVTKKKKWYIACLIGNQKFVIKELFWDDVLINEMLKREVSFWNDYVVAKVMPIQVTYRDTETIEGLFPLATEGKEIMLSDEANVIIENLQSLKEDAKNVEGLIETSENQLKILLGTAEAGSTSLYRVSWSNQRVRRFDVKAFEQVHPELCKQFKPEKITRRFNYKPLEDKNANT